MKTRKQILQELGELKEELNVLMDMEFPDGIPNLYQDIKDKEIWIKAYEWILYDLPRIKDKRGSQRNLNREMDKV